MNAQDIGLGTRLRRLLELLDGDLEGHYAETIPGYRPRFTPIVKALADGTARTIKSVAAQSGVSHSAASQTVTLMLAEGLLRHEVGQDARERMIRLSEKGAALLPQLQAQWRRTDQAARALEAEIGLPLSEAAAAAIRALETRPFRDRIRGEA
jgi:DNA-binding MarR family transcriptional regulator